MHGVSVTSKRNDVAQKSNMGEFIEQLWSMISAHPTNRLLSKDIFVMGDGLAYCIIQNVLNNNLVAKPGNCDFL